MKIFAIILLLSFVQTIRASQLTEITSDGFYWEKVTNMPQQYLNSYWLDIYFLESNPRYGWACGYGGRVIRTTDGGQSWRGVTIITTHQLESIHFVGPLVGYTSGEGSIYRSSDGGATWRSVSPIEPDVLLWGTYFLDENEGFIVGGNCLNSLQKFYRTTNGGISWQNSLYFYNNTKLSDVMVDKNTGLGYASSSGLIWRTTDKGITWAVHSQTGDYDWQEEITNYGKSFLVPYSKGCDGNMSGLGGLRFSTNYGASWIDFSTSASMYGTFLIDSLRGWGCGIYENVYYTSDGGKNWISVNCGLDPSANLDDIWFVDDTTGWLAGEGLYRLRRNDMLEPMIYASGNIAICEGDSVVISLTNSFYPPYSIVWSNGVVGSNSITVRQSGTYSVFLSQPPCRLGYSNEITVTVNPKPQIILESSNTNPPCKGDTVVLSILSKHKKIYWLTGETDYSIEVTETGTYSVIAENEYGCLDTASITIVFNKLPEPRIIPQTRTNICIGDTVLLMVQPDFPSVTWFDEAGDMVGSGKYFQTGESGKFYALVIDNNGCTNVSDIQEVIVRDETNYFVLVLEDEPNLFAIDSTKYPYRNCRYLIIKNISNTIATLDQPYLYHNLSFSIPQSQLPLRFNAGEEKSLSICYSPQALGVELDTLIIEDICSDHHLPLVSFGLKNYYSDLTNCNVLLNLETIDIMQGTDFVISSPYPNPAISTVNISFLSYIDKRNKTTLQAKLLDTFGNEAADAVIIIDSETANDSGTIYSGIIQYDMTNLSNGIFLAVVSLNNSHKTQRILISR